MSIVSRKGSEDLINQFATSLSTEIRNSRDNAKEHAPIDINHQLYIQIERSNFILISNGINTAAEKAFYHLLECFYRTETFRLCYTVLHNLPKNYGSIKTAIATLQGISPLEQMMALNYWFYNGNHSISENQYTFCFSNDSNRLKGRSIPLSIKKGAKSMMEVKLGNRSREYPALKYGGKPNSMEICDPWREIITENFVYHLEALEIVRQPKVIAATLIKGNAFESEFIDENWRYGITGREACVEIPKQLRLSKKNQAIKAESAAYNLFKLIHADLADVDLCDHYRNPLIYVTANDILQSYQAGTNNLHVLMLKLMTAKLGPFSEKLQELVEKAS